MLTQSLIGRYNKITNLAHKFDERELKSEGNAVKLILKYSFFFNFVANFFDKGNLVIRKA